MQQGPPFKTWGLDSFENYGGVTGVITLSVSLFSPTLVFYMWPSNTRN